MVSLSLCMIVKDGEATLAQTLAKTKPYVKDLIVVDTGSTDNSVAIAKAAGAKVYQFNWRDNFSAARNESLKHATGDYVIVLDADEYIDDWDAVTKALTTNDTAYKVTQRNYTDPTKTGWQEGYVNNPLVRLFKNDKTIQYTYRVHEGVEPSIHTQGGTIASSTIVIHHKGFGKGDTETKRDYYLKLGLLDIQDHPNDPKPHYEVGLIYFNREQYDKAHNHLQTCYNLKPTYKRVGAVLAQTKAALNQPNEAITILARYLKLKQDDAAAYNTLGMFYISANKENLAARAFESALVINGNNHAALLNRGMLHLKQKEHVAAKHCFTAVLEQIPDHETARINLAGIAVEEGNKKEAISILEPLVDKSSNPRVYSNLAQLYMQHNNKTRAKELFTKAISLGSPYKKQFEELMKNL